MKKLVERKRRFDAKIAVLIATGLLAMPVWAQDVVSNASNGMNAAAVNNWAPKLSAVAITLGALGIGIAGGHAMKGAIAGLTIATLIAINSNTIVGWIQSIS